jgi:hypothetical protein
METITKWSLPLALAMALLLDATWAASVSAAALTLPTGGLAATKSGNDLVLSFPTTSPELYTVQAGRDLLGEWTNFQPGIPGDGKVKTVTITNALPGGKGFYRLLIQRPASLVLPQSTAFAILGYWCGGIREEVYVTGFDPTSGYPTGDVYLSTTCSGSGRGGGRPTTHTAWAAVTWDFAGNVISAAALTNRAVVNPTFMATDVYSDTIYNAGAAAYLVVPTPAAPTGVTAVQSGDQFEVSWALNGLNPAAITSTTLTATPVNSTATILTATVPGPATAGVITSLQPQTTYQITVVNTTISGSSPTSTSLRVTTVPASVPPSAPTGVAASWANSDSTGTTDTLDATWQAAVPGDSPIDQYRITIIGSDGAGTFSQTVSGTTMTASFTVNYIPNWSMTVEAHNAIGWGPASTAVTLGGL